MPPQRKTDGVRRQDEESAKNDETPRGWKELVKRLRKEENLFKRSALFTGYLFYILSKKNVDAYLVGGTAVAFYTSGQFTTGDIDITVTDTEKAVKLLKQMGFEKTGRIWLNQKLTLAIDIIVDTSPSSKAKARTILIERFQIKVVGVEDLIIDRLVAAKYWRSSPKYDIEQATVLFKAYLNSIDKPYIKQLANAQHVDDYLQEIEEWATKQTQLD